MFFLLCLLLLARDPKLLAFPLLLSWTLSTWPLSWSQLPNTGHNPPWKNLHHRSGRLTSTTQFDTSILWKQDTVLSPFQLVIHDNFQTLFCRIGTLANCSFFCIYEVDYFCLSLITWIRPVEFQLLFWDHLSNLLWLFHILFLSSSEFNPSQLDVVCRFNKCTLHSIIQVIKWNTDLCWTHQQTPVESTQYIFNLAMK